MCFLVAQSVWATTPPPTGFIDASTYGGGYNTTDATAALQAAINTGQNVFVPKESADWSVTPIALSHSNQEILFESGVEVTAKAGAFTGGGDCLFNVTGSGVSMVGPGATLKMQQADYTKSPYSVSESRHAINLMGVTNCTIDGLNILNTGGDGVIVNAGNGKQYSQGVTIENCTINNAYRNGISVISVKNLLVDNCTIVNTAGTLPKDGMDFEPDNSNEVLQNCIVRNTIINSNSRSGIEFIFGHLTSANTYPMTGSSLEKLTIVGNGSGNIGDDTAGIIIDKYLPGLTIKDLLVGENKLAGIVGPPEGGDPLSVSLNVVTNSALWGNLYGPAYFVTLDGTTQTEITPTFYSTDINSPYYMCLDPSCDPQITHGASDGSYMGARAMVPEPAMAGLLLSGAASLLGFVSLKLVGSGLDGRWPRRQGRHLGPMGGRGEDRAEFPLGHILLGEVPHAMSTVNRLQGFVRGRLSKVTQAVGSLFCEGSGSETNGCRNGLWR
jgi:hypothetical protein